MRERQVQGPMVVGCDGGVVPCVAVWYPDGVAEGVKLVSHNDGSMGGVRVKL